MKIALAMQPALTPDLMGPDQWRRLESVGDIIDRAPLTNFAEARAANVLAQADVLLTGWGCPLVDAAALERAPALRLIAHTGSTVKPIVSDAAWARGITVTSAALANAQPVAEYTLAMILLANKRAFAARENYRRDRKPAYHPWKAPGEPGNNGAVVGIVGASRTARRLFPLLKNFALTVLVYDPVADPAELRALGVEPVALPALFERSDVVSLHAPLLPQTHGMIDAKLFRLMRDGATFINTARGDIVNQADLERELVSGRIWAVLDVTSPEPLNPDTRMLDLPNVFVTPHVAGAAGFETRRMADLIISEIERFASGRSLDHEVKRSELGTVG